MLDPNSFWLDSFLALVCLFLAQRTYASREDVYDLSWARFFFFLFLSHAVGAIFHGYFIPHAGVLETTLGISSHSFSLIGFFFAECAFKSRLTATPSEMVVHRILGIARFLLVLTLFILFHKFWPVFIFFAGSMLIFTRKGALDKKEARFFLGAMFTGLSAGLIHQLPFQYLSFRPIDMAHVMLAPGYAILFLAVSLKNKENWVEPSSLVQPD